jgi:hypothetical protein
MYVYYEHHRDANNKIVLTELRLSSYNNGKLAIAFKTDPMEEIVFKAVVPLCKWPPLSNYSYEPTIKVWSYFGQYGVAGTYGEEVIKKIQTVVEALMQPFKAFEIEDLAGQAVNDRVDLSGAKRKPKMSAEEFFYNHGVAQSAPVMTREQLEKKLTVILNTSIVDKKSYRAAAMRLHPDRNNGDSKGMTELNYLWQEYQKLTKETTNAGA